MWPGLSIRTLLRLAASIGIAAALLEPSGLRAADPQPYAVQIGNTGEPLLDEAINDSSTLISLRESAPAGAFALVARARQDSERFLTALRSFGYYQGRVEILIAGRKLDDAALLDRIERAAPAPPIPVTVRIDKGTLFHLRKVEIHGAVPDEARTKLALNPGAPAVASQVLDARERLLNALRDQGYARAAVAPPVGTLVEQDHAIDIGFEVQTGPRIRLGEVAVTGAERMNESFVRQRVAVKPGDRFDPGKIEQTRQDLAALGVFSSVRARAAEELDAQGNLPIEFDLTERKRRVASVSAAFSTDLGGSISLSWRHRNLFGNAEQLSLTGGVMQLGGNSTTGVGYNVGASFLKPDFLAREQTLQADLGALKQSLIAYDQKAILGSLLLNRQFAAHWSGSAGLTAEQAQITQQGVTRDYTLLGLPVTVKYDDTDSLLDPTHGVRAAASVTPTQPLAGPKRQTFVIMQASASGYLDLGVPGRSILAMRGLMGVAEGAGQFDLPPTKRFYAGGSATVRGYRFQSIGPHFPDNNPQGGTAVVAGSLEFRQRVLDDYGAVVFVDAGQVSANGAPFSADWRLGAGVGARYYTAMGPLRIDVALPINREPGSGSFELYIGLGQAF